MQKTNYALAFPELNGKVVLNVDDNDLNQLIINKIMQNVGIKCISANNGKEAIALLEDNLKPDFILLDLEMPVLPGVATAQIIRKQIDEHIPIIINSGFISLLERWKLSRLNVEDFLEKPYNMQDIFSKLSKNLQLASV